MNNTRISENILHERPVVSIKQVQRAVAAYYGVTTVDLLARRRDVKSVRARHIAMYLAKKMTAKSFPVIGHFFGGMDHSSIMHGVNKIENQKNADADLASVLNDLERIIPDFKYTEVGQHVEDMAAGARAAKNAVVQRAKRSLGVGLKGPAIELRDRLYTLFGEVVQIHGLISAGVKMELLLANSGTWTILEIDQKTGTAKMITHGEKGARSSQSIPAFTPDERNSL